MFSYQSYLTVHIFAAFMVFMGLGAAVIRGAYEKREENKGPFRALSGLTHGVGLMILLITGFGLIAQLNVGFQIWMLGKMAIWLALGVVLSVALRAPRIGRVTWFTILALGAAAVFLAVHKPWM